MDGLSKSVNGLVKVGIGVFIIILVMTLIYSAFAQSKTSIFTSQGGIQTNTVNTVNAINIVGANVLSLLLTGSTGWISATNPLTIAVTGNGITAYATNLVYATPAVQQTLTFTVTSGSAVSLGGATTGNFYNITSVVLSGFTAGASPSISAQVTENYAGVVHLQVPWVSNTANSISQTATQSYPVLANYTTYAGGAANQFGSNIGLAIFAVIFAAIILAVVSSLREATGGGESGGFL